MYLYKITSIQLSKKTIAKSKKMENIRETASNQHPRNTFWHFCWRCCIDVIDIYIICDIMGHHGTS